MKQYIRPIFAKNFFTPGQWVFVGLLLVSNSVFPLGDRLKPLKTISNRSNVNQAGEEAQSGTKRRSHEQRKLPKRISRSDFHEILGNSNGTKSPDIGHIADSIIQRSIEEIPRIGEIPNDIAGDSNSVFFDIPDDSAEDNNTLIVPYVGDISDKLKKTETTLNNLPSIRQLIALEQRNVETRSIAEKFTQVILNRDIKGYRSLLDYILKRNTPLQVFIVFQVTTIEGNTVLHWLSTVHSKEWNQELKYMLGAFGVYDKQSGDTLQEMRKEIALTELDQDNLWESESVTDLNNFEPAMFLKNQQIQDSYDSLSRELLKPGNTRLFLATITRKTHTGKSFFDLVKRITEILSSNSNFIEEIKQITKLITPPLYIKNQRGLTPLQMALHTSKNRRNETVTLLSKAEASIEIDTDTISSVNNKKHLVWISTVVAIGATCAYMFY